MKVINITVDGKIGFIFNDIECVTDINDSGFTDAEVELFSDEIENLQSNGFQELHLEKNSMRAFVHKVGFDTFISEKDPDKYEIFTSMDQWASVVHEAGLIREQASQVQSG